MIDFTLNDEHRLLEQSIREWGAQNVAPFIRDNDRRHYFDRERIVGGMARLGLLGISVPQQYGGAGMDYIALGIASEELEYFDTSLRVIMSVHAGLNCLTLLSWGNDDQKTRYLVPQAQGRKIAGYGLTEPSAGSDARAIQTTAVRRGDRYVLNGEKSWISLADVADNFLVIAWTDAEKKKQRDPGGLSAFIVERTLKGFSSAPMKEKWGILAGNTGFFKMDDVEVPAENLLGREGEGFKIAMFALDQGRYTVAAGATGLIRACRDASVKYAKERKTFGVEIGQHQLVKEMIAQMESDYQAARLLWLRSGWLKNHGTRNTRETGLAKWFATVASERAAADAVQIHGANGYSDEYPVGRYFRNCKGAVIYEGTREIHKIMQADYLLGYRTDRPTRCDLPAYESEKLKVES
ncbi:MAG TPA: acyl-CoA dehydrogenase family protein [Vicinamibacterales bacterium]|nr:acyl-CoA dehydrogenase family protein [Vicinamibacterales bacterium]